VDAGRRAHAIDALLEARGVATRRVNAQHHRADALIG
jgi:hypothetical protein